MNSQNAVAAEIDRLANEEAQRIIRNSRTAIIMTVCPEWMRADEAEAFFGIPSNQLKTLAINGEVRAKKLDPLRTTSAVIYSVEDIRAAIGRMTPYATWRRTRPDLKTQTNGTRT